MKLFRDLLAVLGLITLVYVLSAYRKGPVERVGEKIDRGAREMERELHGTS